MSLTDTAARKAKPRTKAYRLFDAHGLYLEIAPSGGKWWRLKYRFAGKEKRLSLGVYGDVSLKEARERCNDARKQLSRGIDPSEQRKAAKTAQRILAENSFEAVARSWFVHVSPSLAETTKSRQLRWLENDIFPWIGSRPIADLTAPDVLAVVLRVKERGATDIARRVHFLIGRVCRYAVAHGIAKRDPSKDIELQDILPPVKTIHHASVKDPQAAGELMRAIEGYTGALITRCALRLAPLVFVRPGELRRAEWAEIDLEKREWRIPANKMKMKTQHIVPLSKQAISVLREIQTVTGNNRHVFPSERGGGRPMSENTVNAALRRIGYSKEEMTGHGFRSLASTLLHELGWPHAVIERQLSHGERNAVSAAYNHAEHLPERRKMMQAWADYLDSLCEGARIIPINKAG